MIGARIEDGSRRGSALLETTTATVVSLADLLDLKRAAGRPIDLADGEALRAIDEKDGSQ